MKPEDLAALLDHELKKRSWSVSRLSKEAGLPFETTRRAVRGMGNVTLDTTTKLLVAVGRELAAVEVTK